MAIILNDNLQINVGKPADSKYLNGLIPYANITEVNNIILITQRYLGLTVNINGVEYWYKNGVTNDDLEEKFISFTGGTVVVDANNTGSGSNIYSGKASNISGDTLQFRSIKGSGNTNVTTVNNEIIIFSSGSSSNNVQPYTGASPSNIVVGGMDVGTVLSGKSLSDIIELMSIATFPPALSNPSSTFVDNQNNIQEVGVLIPTIQFTAEFDQGSIDPQYTATSNKRSGLPNFYDYTGFGLSDTGTTSLEHIQLVNNYRVVNGSNNWSSTIRYDAGVQPFDSAGNPFSTPLSSGTTSSKSVTITGIYPWFYGKVSSPTRPVANQSLINSGTKTVANSSGNISVNYNAVGEWIWFAIPESSTSKTKWIGSNSASNTGSIGGTGVSNLFPDPTIVQITSPQSPTINWTNINYKIYISNFATSTNSSGTPYTLTFQN